MSREIIEEPQATRTAIMQDEQLFNQRDTGILRARQVVIIARGILTYMVQGRTPIPRMSLSSLYLLLMH
jgi:hypothetical protein